jgi:hypothetical protein
MTTIPVLRRHARARRRGEAETVVLGSAPSGCRLASMARCSRDAKTWSALRNVKAATDRTRRSTRVRPLSPPQPGIQDAPAEGVVLTEYLLSLCRHKRRKRIIVSIPFISMDLLFNTTFIFMNVPV